MFEVYNRNCSVSTYLKTKYFSIKIVKKIIFPSSSLDLSFLTFKSKNLIMVCF